MLKSPRKKELRTRKPSTPRKLLQKPTIFDGSTLRESYFAQFEIVANINNWDEFQ